VIAEVVRAGLAQADETEPIAVRDREGGGQKGAVQIVVVRADVEDGPRGAVRGTREGPTARMRGARREIAGAQRIRGQGDLVGIECTADPLVGAVLRAEAGGRRTAEIARGVGGGVVGVARSDRERARLAGRGGNGASQEGEEAFADAQRGTRGKRGSRRPRGSGGRAGLASSFLSRGGPGRLWGRWRQNRMRAVSAVDVGPTEGWRDLSDVAEDREGILFSTMFPFLSSNAT
jgi:hypothetical protein